MNSLPESERKFSEIIQQSYTVGELFDLYMEAKKLDKTERGSRLVIIFFVVGLTLIFLKGGRCK